MRRLHANDIVLKALGLLLLTAAMLKGHELLTVPVANKDLWSWRPFLIFQVECELAMGLWLLSGLLRPLAWLAALLCFGLFCCVTLYKGLTGATSCGCFGAVHVDPWVTLLAVDLPAAVALGLFRPRPVSGPLPLLPRNPVEFAKPVSSLPRLVATAILGLSVLGLTVPILALHEPATATSAYEVLEPGTWVGRELPVLQYIDIAEQISEGARLVLFYHHDCPDCQRAILQYGQMARDLAGNEDLLRIALIEVPPYGPDPAGAASSCMPGRLADVKEWFLTTPVTVFLVEGRVKAIWEESVPDLDTILRLVGERGAAKCADSDPELAWTCRSESNARL